MPELPARPSVEHLRKAAKRLARERSIRLAEAQRALARDYGFREWAAMLRNIEERDVSGAPAAVVPPLFAAVRARDLGAVCAALADGANPRNFFDGETALHAAARHGPLPLVEALIEGGALEWQTDASGRTALDIASAGAVDRDAIVALLDRNAIADPSFRAAVNAIHAGDVAGLAGLLATEPRLLHVHNVGPDAYRRRRRADYFRDPKLFWYVANNPRTVEHMPANIVAVAQVMIERGVDAADLDYTLGLAMTSSVAREQGHQRALMRLLLDAGATVTRDALASTAAHLELEPLRALLAAGHPLDAPLAATFGDIAALRSLLPHASREDVALAFGLAVLNGHADAARLALDAGADVDAFLPVHAHSTALHQAAGTGKTELVALLLAAGARTDIRDTLWDGTPLGWARYNGHVETVALLEGAPSRAGVGLAMEP